jgi:hypothetical protein
MLRVVFLASMLAFGVASNARAQELEVSNVRSGLVCPERVPVDGSVCVETTEIPIIGRGVCVCSGFEFPCTWYGYEFEYVDARPDDRISCVVTTDRAVDYGDPRGAREQNTNRVEFSFKLSGSAGRFFNPQYTIIDPRAAAPDLTLSETVCSLGERELFRFQWRLDLPASRQLDP